MTARISKISSAGVRTTVMDNLPSTQTSPNGGSDKEGVAAVTFIGNTLYALLVGRGCSHANPNVPNGIYRVNRNNSTWTLVANLSQFVKTHPIKNPDVGDFEPDGNWYGMVAVNGVLYATEANHQEVDRITTGGKVTRVIDLSTRFVPPANWQGPTGITFHWGKFYVATLGTFPVRPGTQNLYQLTPSGVIKVAASGLTAVLGVAFDARGRLFALETDTVAGLPGPQAVGTGKVVCVNGNGTLTTVASGLTFPTGMTFGPDGNLYVSNIGFGIPKPGTGQIVRIDTRVNNCK
ncbi:MAG: ScyD/ScyE family protein [Ktedonobacteraceae bacterium]